MASTLLCIYTWSILSNINFNNIFIFFTLKQSLNYNTICLGHPPITLSLLAEELKRQAKLVATCDVNIFI